MQRVRRWTHLVGSGLKHSLLLLLLLLFFFLFFLFGNEQLRASSDCSLYFHVYNNHGDGCFSRTADVTTSQTIFLEEACLLGECSYGIVCSSRFVWELSLETKLIRFFITKTNWNQSNKIITRRHLPPIYHSALSLSLSSYHLNSKQPLKFMQDLQSSLSSYSLNWVTWVWFAPIGSVLDRVNQ